MGRLRPAAVLELVGGDHGVGAVLDARALCQQPDEVALRLERVVRVRTQLHRVQVQLRGGGEGGGAQSAAATALMADQPCFQAAEP